MNLREAAEQALEALQIWQDSLTDPSAIPGWRFAVVGEKAIANLRAALAEDRSAGVGRTSDQSEHALGMVIASWQERCEHHPDHLHSIVTEQMLRDRMQEEIDDLRAVLLDHIPDVSKMVATSQESRQVEPVANDPDPYHLSRILHELAGAASMCWEHVDRAGVFQSTQAAEFVAAAIDEIRQRMKDAPPEREPLPEEEISKIFIYCGRDKETFARAIERAHGIWG